MDYMFAINSVELTISHHPSCPGWLCLLCGIHGVAVVQIEQLCFHWSITHSYIGLDSLVYK